MISWLKVYNVMHALSVSDLYGRSYHTQYIRPACVYNRVEIGSVETKHVIEFEWNTIVKFII